jgi:uncharacterized protein
MYFIQAQQTKNQWWRYLLTIMILLGVQFFGTIPFYLLVFFKTQQGIFDITEFQKTLDFELLGLSQNTGLLILLIPSVLSAIVLYFLMVYLHQHKPGNIFSSAGKFRWNRLWIGSLIWLTLSVFSELIASRINPGNYEFHFDAARFLPLVILSLVLIPFQAGFEELLFRSYFMQGIGILTRYRIIALLVTSACFGLMHSLNPEVNEFGFWNSMLFYMGFGVLAGLLVVFDNGIELAIGVHTINNIFGCLFVTYDSSVLKTAALWKIQTLDIKLMNFGFVIMAIFFLAAMAIIFKWGNWKKLIQPLNFKKDVI